MIIVLWLIFKKIKKIKKIPKLNTFSYPSDSVEDLVIANFWPTVCELKVDKVSVVYDTLTFYLYYFVDYSWLNFLTTHLVVESKQVAQISKFIICEHAL